MNPKDLETHEIRDEANRLEAVRAYALIRQKFKPKMTNRIQATESEMAFLSFKYLMKYNPISAARRKWLRSWRWLIRKIKS